MSGITLVVLAAGRGSRFGGAKQLAEVGPGGETLLDYAVHDGIRAGCSRVVFVISEELRAAFEEREVARWADRVEVRTALQRQDPARAKPWGAADALLSAAPHVPGDFLVCNADDFYGAAAFAALATYLRTHSSSGALAGYHLGDTLSEHGGVARALCRTDAQGWLRRVVEHTGISVRGGALQDDFGRVLAPEAAVSMNLWALRQDVMEPLGRACAAFERSHADDPEAEYRLPDFVNAHVSPTALRIRVLPARGRWFGVTHPEDLERARAELRGRIAAGEYPARLFA